MRQIQDTIYDEFRGSEILIKDRQRKYIRYFNSCYNVLDIGCGRGEFMELLEENSISATGIDVNEDMVEICHRKGFNVLQVDTHSFLKDKTENYDGIFCSHVIEHIAPQDVLAFLDLCRKALKPQGIFIIITPNPKNLCVITDVFWLDLTHTRPYPLQLLERLLTEIGFKVIASGEDKDTVPKGGWRRRILSKLDRRLTGGLISSGMDNFLVGRVGKTDNEEEEEEH